MSKTFLPASLAVLSLSASPAALAQSSPLTAVITVDGDKGLVELD